MSACLVLAIVLTTTIAGATVGAQPGPPDGGGAPSSSSANTLPPQLDPAVVEDAIFNVAEEASLLQSLGAFSDVPPDLVIAIDENPEWPTSRPEQIAAFDAVDESNQQSATTLLAMEPPISKELATVLPRLSAADHEAIVAGRTVSLSARTYLEALDDLVQRGGRPPQTGARTIDPGRIAANIAAQMADEPTPTVVPTDPPASGGGPTSAGAPVTATAQASPAIVAAGPRTEAPGGLPLIPIAAVVLLLVVVAGMGFMLARRSSPNPALAGSGVGATAGAAGRNAGAAPVADSRIDDLLEVSRRLSAVTSVNEVERATVREAVGLVSATAAAFVRCVGEDLVIAHQTQDEMLILEHLRDGIIGRVAETGQPVLQVSATEPAVRNLPVALGAVPIVGRGRVTAVLLLMRASSEPFADRDRELLMALAPVAATALLSAERAESLAEASLVDPLTNVGNRRRLDTELVRFLTDAAADGRSTGVIMVDLDHFKAVNDNHGHPAGDAILRRVSAVIRDNVRPHDHVYRYGGEEFCVVLPDTSSDDALQTAERVGHAVRGQSYDAGVEHELSVTVSMGVATTTAADGAALIARADRALYAAKESGRDRAVLAPDA